MKIHIAYPITDGPWGGGNQFLKALKNSWVKNGMYAHKPESADAILFNSHHYLNLINQYLRSYPDKMFIHRLDGVPSLFRNNAIVDRQIIKFNSYADLTIFQSHWSKDMWQKHLHSPQHSVVIPNAPDPDIFYKKSEYTPSKKPTIIATSWSPNWSKGFKYYQWLDSNADFSKISVIFVGNSPIKFHNIQTYPPMKSSKLATKLRASDIYLTASENDACPNALLEALACGLPAIVLDSGGHRELIGGGGITFSTKEELLTAIDQMTDKLIEYRKRVRIEPFTKIIQKYTDCITTTTKKNSSFTRIEYFTNRVRLKLDKAGLVFYKQVGFGNKSIKRSI